MNAADDARFMAEAFRLAWRGLGSTDPNPRVGCVLVRDGKIVGRGYHIQDGHGHAEANALADAGESARGATAYVTLEPCSFRGRTPSCASALVTAGVTRVVAAATDPHPRNQGAGFEILRQAGITVETGVLESEATGLNPGLALRYVESRPFVRLKLAMSLDGRTALANGESQWITGPEARQDVQRLRARSMAIVTGVQTVIDDDPSLTVRADELSGLAHPDVAVSRRRPVYVLDPNNRAPANLRLRSNPDATWVTLADDLPMAINDGHGRIDLRAFLAWLATEGECNEVLFECGATLGGALVAQDLVDELVVYVAPKLMGADARALLQLPEIDTMGAVKTMQISDVRQVGTDVRLTLARRKESS